MDVDALTFLQGAALKGEYKDRTRADDKSLWPDMECREKLALNSSNSNEVILGHFPVISFRIYYLTALDGKVFGFRV